MKRMLRILSLIAPLLLTLASAPDALAYYDPGVQRWINRDPIQERGGANLHHFVSNNPAGQVDAFGEKTAGDGRYGDCTKEQHNNLHSALGTACKGSGQMKCLKSDDCDTIKSKIAKFDACIAARVLYNDTCWSGESSIEKNEIKNARTGRQNCQDLSCQKNCK